MRMHCHPRKICIVSPSSVGPNWAALLPCLSCSAQCICAPDFQAPIVLNCKKMCLLIKVTRWALCSVEIGSNKLCLLPLDPSGAPGSCLYDSGLVISLLWLQTGSVAAAHWVELGCPACSSTALQKLCQLCFGFFPPTLFWQPGLSYLLAMPASGINQHFICFRSLHLKCQTPKRRGYWDWL